MDRFSDSKKASTTTAPNTTLMSLLAMCLAMPSVAQAKQQADGFTGRIRSMVKAQARRLGFDTEGNAAVTGIVELLVGFIVLVFCIFIAFLLIPLVNSSSATLAADENTTDEQRSILPVVGLIIIVCVVVMALGFMFVGFRNLVGTFK